MQCFKRLSTKVNSISISKFQILFQVKTLKDDARNAKLIDFRFVLMKEFFNILDVFVIRGSFMRNSYGKWMKQILVTRCQRWSWWTEWMWKSYEEHFVKKRSYMKNFSQEWLKWVPNLSRRSLKLKTLSWSESRSLLYKESKETFRKTIHFELVRSIWAASLDKLWLQTPVCEFKQLVGNSNSKIRDWSLDQKPKKEAVSVRS